MTNTTSPLRAQARTPLSRERVLGAAVELADEGGLTVLSMRRLAQHLGVEAMSLYHYVKRKDDILGGMLDMVFDEIELPRIDGSWRAAIRASAISAHHVLLQHHWACSLLMTPSEPSRAQLTYMDAVLGRLRGAGLTVEQTHHAYHALDSHIVGYTLWLLPYLALVKERPNIEQEFLADLPVDELPYLFEHVEYHLAGAELDGVSGFEFGLDLILDGLERIRG